MSLITLKRADVCADCGAALPAGTQARYYRNGKVYGLACHEQKAVARDVKHVAGQVIGQLEAALARADEAGDAAAREYAAKYYRQPAFAVVENGRGDLFSDPSKPEKVVGAMYDVCGFVWLEVSFREGKRLLAEFRKLGIKDQSGHRWELGGMVPGRFGGEGPRWELSYSQSHSVWSTGWTLRVQSVGYGNGSMTAMEQAGGAFARSMEESGYPGLRMCSHID